MSIRSISAVTFAVSNMARSVPFYLKLGFELGYGGPEAAFTSFKAGGSFVNLVAAKGYSGRWWGRAIFRVDDVDAHYSALLAAHLQPDEPKDAAWGERFFHVTDPDGHELSFAEPLPGRPGEPLEIP